ncbi:MAG: hypothetical protein ACPHTD_09250 [Gammaproteobacteria bacterium]|jgi:hypothetical protein
MTDAPERPYQPDLDWSQIRETVLMLNLAVGRIEHALNEGNDSVAALTDSFTTMVEAIHHIGVTASTLPPSDTRTAVEAQCQEVHSRINAAIVAFQFYDKLTQRLRHVSNGLNGLSDQVTDPAKLFNPFEWRNLQERIRSNFTLDSDLRMLDALLSGQSIEEVLALDQLQEDVVDDVELF